MCLLCLAGFLEVRSLHSNSVSSGGDYGRLLEDGLAGKLSLTYHAAQQSRDGRGTIPKQNIQRFGDTFYSSTLRQFPVQCGIQQCYFLFHPTLAFS